MKSALFIIFILAAMTSVATETTCDPFCTCYDGDHPGWPSLKVAWCRGKRDLTTVPDFPADIQVLHIYLCSISKLKDSQLKPYGQLERIELDDNNIEQIEQGAFRNMTKVTLITLFHNKITELPSDCFIFSPNLTEVYLHANKIQRLQKNLFSDLKYLKEVYLNNNEITIVEEHCFVNVPQLKVIYLSRNKLISLDIKFIDNPSSLNDLYLFDNPWHCDTSLCEVMDTGLSGKLWGRYWPVPTCTTPQDLTKKLWSRPLLIELCSLRRIGSKTGEARTECPAIVPTKRDKPSRYDGGGDRDCSSESITEAEFLPPPTTVKPLFEDHQPEVQTLQPPFVIPELKEPTTQTELPFTEEAEPTTTQKVDIEYDEIDEDVKDSQTKSPLVEKNPQCALPMVSGSGSYENGYRFQGGSRLEYDQSRGRYRNSYNFSVEFQTTEENGLIFYVADQNHLHYVAVYLIAGKLQYVFSCGMGPADLPPTDTKYNDDSWHSVVLIRNITEGKLVVDDKVVASGRLDSTHSILNITPPYYLGAMPQSVIEDVKKALKTYSPFTGCIRNFLMNGKKMQHPRIIDAVPCQDNLEPGVFFGARGGFVRLKDTFIVGIDTDIKMDVKPRNITGLLMAVHGRRDYFTLEMIDGVLKLSVNNGKGPIEAVFKPATKYYFCDGLWHSIQAIKSKNVVALSVDKTFADAGVGELISTDTRFGLYLGGHPLFNSEKKMKFRGIQTHRSFVGCIRNVRINNEPVEIEHRMLNYDVVLGSCPTD